MRRDAHDGNSVLDKHASKSDGLLVICRAVVYAGNQVKVKVDVPRQSNDRSEYTAPPRQTPRSDTRCRASVSAAFVVC